jgi:hypothetical protein
MARTCLRCHDSPRVEISMSRENEAKPDAADEAYRAHRRDFRARSLSGWSLAVRELAEGAHGAAWHEPAEVARALARLATHAPLNHCYLPAGGGLDLSDARVAEGEPSCVELAFEAGTVHRIVRPAVLRLVRAQRDPLDEWCYVRLECAALPAVKPHRDPHVYEETVRELAPGRYADLPYPARAAHDPERAPPAPARGRVITRQLQGTCLLFAKGSVYNALGAYDGGHGALPHAELAAAIQLIVDRLHASGAYGVDPLLA